MKKKSLSWNAILNAIKTISGMIFPLITFPYISRVLHVDNMGIYNFCRSIISYFTLLAGLGINTYAIREGARYRTDKDKMSEFSSEIFSINFISTIISYAVLILCIAFISRLREDAPILLTLSLSIIFSTIGCEWIFTIYEDFGFITVRSIIFQFVSLILMFAFVRSENDLISYAIITVLSSSGANVINAIARQKYCKIKFVFNNSMRKRMIPILLLFANTVATTIYTSSDTTMLGIFAGNKATGLYSVSTKVYEIVKNILSAIIIVSIPRLSADLGEKKYNEFKNTGNEILNALLVLALPAMIGIFSLSKNIILIISGNEYIEATRSLQILSLALIFCLFSWFYTSCILIPYREEKKVLGATVIAAIVNIGINFILIPIWKQNAAALTTVIAEFLSMVICMSFGRRYFKPSFYKTDIISIIVGCAGIVFICWIVNYYIKSVILSTIIAITCSAFLYGGVLILLKNTSLKFLLKSIKSRK